MALGQWLKTGEPDKYGIALGTSGECTEQHFDVGIMEVSVIFK